MRATFSRLHDDTGLSEVVIFIRQGGSKSQIEGVDKGAHRFPDTSAERTTFTAEGITLRKE